MMASTAQFKFDNSEKLYHINYILCDFEMWKKKKERNQQCLKLHTGNVVSGYIEKAFGRI